MTPSVIILTFNSAKIIKETIASALSISDDIIVIDSYSTDDTLNIIKDLPVKNHQRAFKNYGDQRNWAIENLTCKYPWQLHLDADEQLCSVLTEEIKLLSEIDLNTTNGFLVKRRTIFLGRALIHGGFSSTWHLRLFKYPFGHCESRLYDQHFYVSGHVRELQGYLIDDQRAPLSEWVSRHNYWASLEAEELASKNTEGRIHGDLSGNKIEKTRALRSAYNCMPLFIRPCFLFIYRYFLLLGFLDGIPGLIYCVLQTFWYRFLIDCKLYERTRNGCNR